MPNSEAGVNTCLLCKHMGANLHVHSARMHKRTCTHEYARKYTSLESVYFPSSGILLTPLASLRDQYNF